MSPRCGPTITAALLSPKRSTATTAPRRHLRAVTDTASVEAARLDLGAGDFDIEAPDLAGRYAIDDPQALR